MDISNALTLARRAKENNDTDNAIKYYEMVLLENANDWEASFYSQYFKAMQTSIADISYNAVQLSKTVKDTIRLIKENVESDDKRFEIISQILKEINTLSSALSRIAEEYASKYRFKRDLWGEDEMAKDIDRQNQIENLLLALGDAIDVNFADNEKLCSIAEIPWSLAYERIEKRSPFCSRFDADEVLAEYKEKIRKYDPDFKQKEDEEERIRLANQEKTLEEKMAELKETDTIVENFFDGRDDLVEFTIPEHIKYIESGAFTCCKGLKTIIFPKGCQIEEIPSKAFQLCEQLEKIVFAGSLKKIASHAVSSCKQLKTLDFSGVETDFEIGESAFAGIAIKEIIFPTQCQITKIGKYAFMSCNLQDNTKFSNVKYISGDAFMNASCSSVFVPKDCPCHDAFPKICNVKAYNPNAMTFDDIVNKVKEIAKKVIDKIKGLFSKPKLK